MLLALLWHTGYQPLYLPKVLPESRAGAAGGMESVLGCMGFAGLYPAAPEPGCRLSSAAHPVRNWAPLGLNIGKLRDMCLKPVEGNLQVPVTSGEENLHRFSLMNLIPPCLCWQGTYCLLHYCSESPLIK